MLFLLFQLGSERYAIEAQSAVEVVPLLALKPIPQSPPGVAGVFNYRGRPVPVIDLCALTLGRPAREQLSTRIIILRCALDVPGAAPGIPNAERGDGRPELRLLGVIAERATELLRRGGRGPGAEPANPERSRAAGRNVEPTAPAFLGPVLMDDHGFLQVVRPDHLLPAAVRAALFAQVEAFSYESD